MEDFDKNLKGESGKEEGEVPAGRESEAAPSSPKAPKPQGGGASSGPSGPADMNDGRVVFHYSREHRLSHASPSLRKVYEEGYQLNKGFIKGLTGNAGLRSTFVVIIILCAAIGLISVFGPSSDTGSFYGAEASLSAFSFGENVFVSLSIGKNNGELPAPFPAMVAAEMAVLDGDGAVLTEAIVTGWYSGDETILRCSFSDYDGETVTAALYALGADGMGQEAASPPEGQEEPLTLSAKIRRE